MNDKPSPCSGEDGLVALIMAITAGKSAGRALGQVFRGRGLRPVRRCSLHDRGLDDMAIAAAEKPTC